MLKIEQADSIMHSPSSKLIPYQPFDYVEDSMGWLYLVKAVFLLSGEIVAKAMYYPHEGCLKKCKNSLPELNLILPQPVARFGGFFDFILQQSTISKWNPRTAQILPANTGQVNSLVNHIATTLEQLGAKCYLFGSRALGLHTNQSDWDILILSTECPSKLLKFLLLTFGKTIRLFSTEECQQRANRYASQPNGIDYDVLFKIFQYSTPYLKSDHVEIGLFFSPPFCKPLPFEPNDLVNEQLFSLYAYPIDSIGTSYHLPRRICVQDVNGHFHTIYSVIWELGGIEQVQDILFEFSGLRKIDNYTWWMGGEEATLRIVS